MRFDNQKVILAIVGTTLPFPIGSFTPKVSHVAPIILPLDKGVFVLDVGCGVGVTPCHIAKRHGSRVVGVDISERMADRARQRLTEISERISK